MKKTSVFFLFIILLSSCAPQVSSIPHPSTPIVTTISTLVPTTTFTPRPTLIPTATLIPCPNEPLTFDEITVVFHEKMEDKDCNGIIKYTQLTVAQFAKIGYTTGIVQVNVFATPEAITNSLYDWAKQTGCNPDSKESIFNLWTSRGMQAMSTRGSVFLLTNLLNNAWRNAEEVERAHAVVHEITQVTEINILGSCQKRWQVPDWYGHGVAEYFAETFTRAWGLPSQDEDLSSCKQKLANLRAGETCIYMQAEMAFKLLREKYNGSLGVALDVLKEMAKGKSFNQAFYDTYNVSVSEFSDDFDTYRVTGY